MTPIELTIAAIASYLCGSIPFGLVIAHVRKVDLRQVGSGNIGATNAARAVERGDPVRAELLMRRPAWKKLDWTSRVPVMIAVAQAHAQGSAADRAREVLADAEASARRGKKAQLRLPLLVRIATAYAEVGADADARRLAGI